MPIRSLSYMRLTARSTGLLGLGSTAVILLGALVTAIPYVGREGEAYSPLSHFVSELGEVPQSRLAWLFNIGLIVGTIGLGVFLVLLSRRLEGRFRRALVVAGLVAGSSGALVGVFPMNMRAVHRPVSLVFFLTGWIVVAIFSAWLAARPRRGFPRRLLAPGGLAIAASMVFLAVYSTYRPANPNGPILSRPNVWSVAWLEWAALLSLLLWFVCVSLVLMRGRTPVD